MSLRKLLDNILYDLEFTVDNCSEEHKNFF